MINHEVMSGNPHLATKRMPVMGQDLLELNDYIQDQLETASDELNNTDWDLTNPEHLKEIISISQCCSKMTSYLDRVSKFSTVIPTRQPLKIGSRFD